VNEPAASRIAFVFPGQGAHGPRMLDGVRHLPAFGERYRLVCDLLGTDPLRSADAAFNANAVSSLCTVFASTLALDEFRRRFEVEPAFFAGYSVGQWTALYAAGVVTLPQLFALVHARAAMMDACVREHGSGMVAVIGVPLSAVEEACRQIRDSGETIVVSNVNCVGNYSLAGTEAALARVLTDLAPLAPKKLARLPVAGAWHSPLLEPARTALARHLEPVALAAASRPVADNVTGLLLPADPQAMKAQLADHVARPVKWQQCVQTLLAAGCTEFVELGFGNELTRFGFFIDRKAVHRSFCPEPPPCAA